MSFDRTARQIFFHAAKWVPEIDRLCYAIEQQAGRQPQTDGRDDMAPGIWEAVTNRFVDLDQTARSMLPIAVSTQSA